MQNWMLTVTELDTGYLYNLDVENCYFWWGVSAGYLIMWDSFTVAIKQICKMLEARPYLW